METHHKTQVFHTNAYLPRNVEYNEIVYFFSWRNSPLVGLGLLLNHEDFCGF